MVLPGLIWPLAVVPIKMHMEHSTVLKYAALAYTIPSVAITTVSDLVRAARNGRSQKEFARELGVRQSSISRYESGKASPPVPVIEHCMRLVHSDRRESIPTADELATKVRTALADTSLGQFRLLISKLIDTLTREHAQACATTAASTMKDKK